ncbi:MAG: peptidyl-alpha-hydroxyglycine alpha-amidating lyase family protein [Dehalococcoidia bacterium]|jgi:DNA-binding beta-propeller fold protein YncE|nr:peptidyl-alpha-hydroxyglycine alpha-amidating lyase family protein [Dehalococcoidia bacterium]MDP6228907.1 peptidyl-alpha-hydroxyglycine alpha-amidating lyase family protein [Dehalococcoidia bacterium]MDP7083319.1 peptidyl-alpha-hydroxyglycine alpha-amidating lyase family protein [Dehalococcoidia bacterium]MDP7200377.1 peptidyl-alpha-hydroxyglycine alpha-amidating lyase family protein [Dehalococcoidia bacterium]MDP7509600.1 peptidyl-alpha-hydroxyglycine alpha-amidating lyase family protein [
MANTYGGGDFQYKFVDDWAKLPAGTTFHECPGVAVDSKDNVYVLTRGEHPIIVLDREGNFVRTFGEGYFSNRTHGLYIAHDDSLLIADDGIHTIQKFSPDGEKLMEIGERNNPAPRWSGQPFNRPTSAAIMPSNGDIYVSDGYGNSRIHVYTSSGEYKLSWGSPGIDAGQFIRPHNIAVDSNDRVYVVDRECHRIQIFDPKGNFITMWNNIHRPDAMVLWQDHIYVGELNGMGGVDDAPGLGHRVTVYDLNGKRVCIFGAQEEGEGAGQFIAPHSVAVDSKGAIYVGEVSFTIRGSKMDPPKELRSLSKYDRNW